VNPSRAGEKLLEELDYVQEARSLLDFRRNFSQDPNVLIPEVYQEYCSPNVLVMEWVDGIRCTDPTAFESDEAKRRFITIGVESGMKQLLEFGLFHGDPHPVSLARQIRVACTHFRWPACTMSALCSGGLLMWRRKDTLIGWH
jgi:predicted unusual protein kinase regulating ubiquinone biosynthesis (AarF/ABC1/UbiB family)